MSKKFLTRVVKFEDWATTDASDWGMDDETRRLKEEENKQMEKMLKQHEELREQGK
jgi:hypothetical protein